MTLPRQRAWSGHPGLPTANSEYAHQTQELHNVNVPREVSYSIYSDL